MQYLEQLIATYWQQHGVVGALAAWVVLSAALNVLFRLKSAEDWVAWADKNPKGHVVVELIRKWGVDPVAVLEALCVYAEKKAAAEEAKKKAEEAKKEES